MKTYALVVAHDEKLGIGKENKLPWHLKADLKHFRQLTIGEEANRKSSIENNNVVIMGRKTWESLPDDYRPLPKRMNVVLSRNANYKLPTGILLAESIEQALDLLQTMPCGNIFLIGGAEVYKAGIENELFQTLYVTQLQGNFSCDTFFPNYQSHFEQIEASEILTEGEYRFTFKTFKRKV